MRTPGPVGVALLGCGTVGREVARSLSGVGHPSLRLRAICTRRVAASRAAAPWVNPDVIWTDRCDAVLTDDVQVVIEVMGGIEPARSWIARALDSGRSVVTANKQVIAAHGPALVALARERGVALRFEAAVGGAVPVIRGVQQGLAADTVTRMAGVINGTSNYVLERMELGGLTLQEAVADAQTRGFAEADPSADLDGVDARAKLVILAAMGFQIAVAPGCVPAESIRGVMPEDFVHAASLGKAIRQVAWADVVDPAAGLVTMRVGPALVDAGSWLARAEGPCNVIVVHGEQSGDTVFAGQGAGGAATAVAVVSDALAVAHADTPPRPWPGTVGRVTAPADCAYYVRITPHGRPVASPDAVFACAGLEVRRTLVPSPAVKGEWAVLLGSCSQEVVDTAIEMWRRDCPGGATALRLPILNLS